MAVKHAAMAMEPRWSSGMEVLQVLPVVILRIGVLQEDSSGCSLEKYSLPDPTRKHSDSGSLGVTWYL